MLPGFEEYRRWTSTASPSILTAGSGPPVLNEHGYPQNHIMWREVTRPPWPTTTRSSWPKCGVRRNVGQPDPGSRRGALLSGLWPRPGGAHGAGGSASSSSSWSATDRGCPRLASTGLVYPAAVTRHRRAEMCHRHMGPQRDAGHGDRPTTNGSPSRSETASQHRSARTGLLDPLHRRRLLGQGASTGRRSDGGTTSVCFPTPGPSRLLRRLRSPRRLDMVHDEETFAAGASSNARSRAVAHPGVRRPAATSAQVWQETPST